MLREYIYRNRNLEINENTNKVRVQLGKVNIHLQSNPGDKAIQKTRKFGEARKV